MATPEQMWFAEFDLHTGKWIDPTHGKDSNIKQALFDHGGYVMYDITEENAIMPVPSETRELNR